MCRAIKHKKLDPQRDSKKLALHRKSGQVHVPQALAAICRGELCPWPRNCFILTIEATKNQGWVPPPTLKIQKWLGNLPLKNSFLRPWHVLVEIFCRAPAPPASLSDRRPAVYSPCGFSHLLAANIRIAILFNFCRLNMPAYSIKLCDIVKCCCASIARSKKKFGITDHW